MLEITGNDIRDLSDSDLRGLVGLLCEAELRAADFPTAGVTWSGHQNAKDGGLDVRVEITAVLHEDCFVPRSITGYQVKKPDMPRAAITSEMRPGGELRKVINDLAQAGGAYIIVSSQGSLADSALIDRRSAMKEALFDCPFFDQIKLDFYDRERIASWVRSHPSLILWVRVKIGRSIQGWKTYGNWTKSPGGTEADYMIDNHIRLHNSANPGSDGLSALDGINELRILLSRPSSSVRLVGLSGVGKTRLLQALFDERIGQKPLNRTQVFYTDMSDSPDPHPGNMAERLVALQKSAILIIDNCPPELHRRLTSICTASDSQVRLITVEYDVRDDQPEETEVFRLEPASNELIEKMIQVRFNHISDIDARTIAEFSGGNARIAIALANTVRRGENLANLRDEELFSRLFQQRNQVNESLLRAAEVCSLVYSFDCQSIEGSASELDRLGSLIGMNHKDLFQLTSELKRRDLVQQRSNWRALLPHAVANRLARRALENIPLNEIYRTFEIAGNERSLMSFSRRLSYLHECDAAKEITGRWLSEKGLLEDISHLNDLGIALFINIAPINPELTLAAIERVLGQTAHQEFFLRKSFHYIEFTRLLRSLAYDKELFERSTLLLCRIAISESPNENNNSIRHLVKSLFHLYMSGTHATAEQRLKIIAKLVESNQADQVDFGMTLLDAALETWHFSPNYGFEFGARSRDYGFTPSTEQEIKNWYKVYVEYAAALAVSERAVAPKVQSVLAENFRGLWLSAGIYDELECVVNMISSNDVWIEGWLAVRSTRKLHKDGMEPSILSRLNKLDALLKPTKLIDQARLYALSDNKNGLGLADTIEIDEDYTETCNNINLTTRSIGQEIAADDEVFNVLLPELLTSDSYRLCSFGQGLADDCVNPYKMWKAFSDGLQVIEETRRRYGLLIGFLNAIEQSVSEKLLDAAVSDRVLAAAFPTLQISVQITERGITRLKQSLDFGVAPIWLYSNLGYRRRNEIIKDEDLSELLRLISSQTDGIEVAIDILRMRLPGNPADKSLSSIIASVGQDLVVMYDFSLKNNRSHMDYSLATIIKKCFIGARGAENASKVCSKIVNSLMTQSIHLLSDYRHVLEAFAKMHPIVFLDTILAEKNLNHRIDWGINAKIPLSVIAEDVVIDWCELNPGSRYSILSSALLPYRKNTESDVFEWTQLALTVIDKCPDPITALNNLSSAFRPTAWSGSRAELMGKCLKLISDLKTHNNTDVVEWAINREQVFAEEIRHERGHERKYEREQNERFE
ncbi:hypothetical protein [Sporomusa aerivorans]|uniref:hypothetical protein n=1 Tax=Sporomusa aerivorans TaxID=204936 RepID=UPI00352A45C8